MDESRRAFLGCTAATLVGIAGCSARSSEPESDPTGTATSTPTEGTATPTEGNSTPQYSGATIPEQPHAGAGAVPPVVGGPHPAVENPVLTGDDVTDYGNVSAVADPFLFVEEGTVHLFFEIISGGSGVQPAIGHATSPDGLDWSYDQVVLDPDSHVSWPYVWKWDGDYYMVPYTGKTVEIWRANSFPTGWEPVAAPLDADYFPDDPAVVRWDDRWWLFVGRTGEGGNDSQTVAFHSERLLADDWTPHAENPIVSGRERGARPAGRPVTRGEDRYLFVQDALDEYGDKVRAYRVTELSTETYADEEVASSPVASEFGTGYNADGMHTYDAWYLGEGEGWLCAVDGKRPGEWTGIGLFHVPETVQPATDSVPVDREAALYYRFRGDGGVAVDDSGSGNHGMVRGTTAADGDIDGGRRFTGPGDRVVAPYDLDTVFDDAFTVLAYVDARGATGTLCDYRKRGTPNWFTLDATSSGQWRARYSTADGDDVVDAPDASGDGLVQVALVATQESTRLFVDGNEVASGAPADVPEVNNYLTVGADLHGNRPWTGTVYRFGVVPEALSATELERVDRRVRDE